MMAATTPETQNAYQQLVPRLRINNRRCDYRFVIPAMIPDASEIPIFFEALDFSGPAPLALYMCRVLQKRTGQTMK
jgi:hypothetical protein